MTSKILTVKHISKSYGENKQSLTDVSFTALPGEVTAIIGPSGGRKNDGIT